MKKVILLLSALFIVLVCNAQLVMTPKTLSQSAYFVVGGGQLDTIKKDSYHDVVIFMKTAAIENFGVQTTYTNVSGKSKAKTVLMDSWDGVNFTRLDSTTVTGAGRGVIAKRAIWKPYVKLRVHSIDSTGVTIFKFDIVTEKIK